MSNYTLSVRYKQHLLDDLPSIAFNCPQRGKPDLDLGQCTLYSNVMWFPHRRIQYVFYIGPPLCSCIYFKKA